MVNDLELTNYILSFGIKPTERIIHFGCGDKQTNFLSNLQTIIPNIFYLGIDANEELIEDFREKYQDKPYYAFRDVSMQEFIDNVMYNYGDETQFETSIITGIFDKPLYKEKQYIFISTIIDKCLLFSNNVIFTIDEDNYKQYNYNVLYVINNLISTFVNVEIKKRFNKYIFYVKT
jgi:hypothetical protein